MNKQEEVQMILQEAAQKLQSIGVLARIEFAETPNRKTDGLVLIVSDGLTGIAGISAIMQEGHDVVHGSDDARLAQFERNASFNVEDLIFRASVYGVQISENEKVELDGLAKSSGDKMSAA